MIFFSKGSKKQKQGLFGGKLTKEVDWLALPKLLTIKKTCELLGVHANTLRNWDDSGKLKAIRVGARKDRRYEREAVKAIYRTQHPELPASTPTTPLPAPSDGGKYVLKPGLSGNKVKLLLISKKFSLFVYSTTIVAFTFVVVQMFFFAHIFVVQAEVALVEPKMLTLQPSVTSGWENPDKAQHLDVVGTGNIDAFSTKNSATYTNRPIVVKGEETDVPSAGTPLAQMPTEQPSIVPPTNTPLTNSAPFTNTPLTNSTTSLEQIGTDLEIGGFKLPGEISPDSMLNDASLAISFGADTYANNEDVITFSYSTDAGQTWTALDSFALTAQVSNATHGGFWEFPLTDKIGTLQNLDSFRVRVNYNAVPGPQPSTAYVDGVNLNITLTEPPTESTVQQLDQSVSLDKKDFTADETPVLDVEVEKKSKLSFLGAKPTTREVKSLTITSPTGETSEVTATGTSTEEKNTTTAEYQIDPKNLKAPGAYTITTTIEQNGYIKEVTETFIWGALAMNTDKSLYQTGDTAHLSIGAVDDNGQTVCDADIRLTITDPRGTQTTLSSKNGDVTVTDFCHEKELYHGPDYQTALNLQLAGTYSIDMEATVNGSTRSLTDAFTVEDAPEFLLQRDGPTRVFPIIQQPMTLTVTVKNDFQGIIREFVPPEYTVTPENGGVEQPFDLGGSIARTIVWDVNLKAGSTVTLKYLFKAPEKSPALFFIGPARIGDWQELRTWQQAIDPTYQFVLATSTSAATGWTNQTTYDGASARFLRGASTYGGTGGATTHTPTVTGATVNATTSGLNTATGCTLRCTTAATYAHAHTTTAPTAGSANNDPAWYSFYLWKNDSGVSTTMPQNTFAFFPSDPGGSWTRLTGADNRLVKLTNSNTTGGSDTHTHTMTWNALAATANSANVSNLIGEGPPSWATGSHSHTAPAQSQSASATSVPPYVNTLIYQQTNATPQNIPQNMIGMFDADPGTGWTIVSNSSPYQNNFIRGNSSEGSTGGSATHNDTATSGASGTNIGGDRDQLSGTSVAEDTHSHTVTATITAGSDHTPPYVDFVLAKCTNASGCGAAATYSVSGNVYSDEGSTLITGTPTIRLLVNGSNTACGGSACTATVSSGAYTISNITTTSGDILLLYLDTAGSPLATTVTVGSGANLTGINLYQNRLIVRHETGTSITNANIATGIGSYSDTDILGSVTTNNLTVTSNIELHIWTGKTYDPNGTVTTQGTGDLHVDDNATAYLDTATSTINNNVSVDTGATLNVQATTTVNGATAGGVTSAGTLNHTAGTFTIGNGTDEDLNVTAGTTTLSGGNTVIADDINNCASGTLNINAGSNVDALSTTGVLNMGNGCSASAILNLNGGSLDVGQHMTLDAGTVNLNGGTHRAGVSADGIVEFARYANGGMTLNMTGGELMGRALIVYNGETLTTTTVTGGTLTVDDLYSTVSAATWYQWNTSSPKFYNLQFNDSANDINSSSVLTYLNGSLINNSAALTTNSKNITIEGNITNTGSITPGTSVFTLAGTSQQTVTGTTTFGDLTITNNSGSDAQTSPSVIFADGYNYTVNGTLTATTDNVKLRFPQGPTYSFAAANITFNRSSAGKIYLRSNASGTQWRFNVTGTQSVSYVDVKDSNAIGSTINASNGTNTDSTNNTNWNFGATISISGTADGNNAATVKVAINGTAQAQSGTIGSGTWTISGVTTPTAGQTITVWVDNVTDANESTGITKYSTGNVSGMVLNTNVTTIGSNQNQTLSVTEATQYTGTSDEDVMTRLNSSTLTTDLFSAYAADQLSILASNGLTIGSTETLDTFNLNNAGTLTSTTTATYTILGSWTNSGTFTAGTSTVTFSAQATGKTINTGGVGATKDFYNVIFDGTGGAWSALTSTMTVTNNLTMTAGTLNNATGSANIQVYGNVQCGASCGTITLTTGTFTVSPNNGTTKTFGTNVAVATNWTFSTLILSTGGTGSNTVRFNGTGTGQIITASLQLASNGATSLTVDNETNDRIIDIGTGIFSIATNCTFQASSTASLTAAGDIAFTGTFTPGSGTLTLDATDSGHTINTGSLTTLNNLLLNGSGGVWSPTNTTVMVGNNLAVAAGTLDNSSGTTNITVNGNVGCSGTCGTINLSAGTFTQSVTSAMSFGTNVAVATNWTFNNLTFTNTGGTSTITINGTGTGQIIVNGNLSLTNSGTALTLDNNTNDRILDVAGNVSIGTGTTLSASNTASFTVAGSWANSGTFTSNGGTVTFDASTTGKTIDTTTFGSLTFNNASGGWNFGSSTITVTQNLNMGLGTITAGTSNVRMTGQGYLLIGGNNTLYDLTINNSGYDIYLDTSDLSVSHALAFTTLGEIYLNSGRTLTIQSTATSSGSGYIAGASDALLIYQPSTISSTLNLTNTPVRFDATSNNITIDGTRMFASPVTMYNSSASARTIYLGSAGGQTLTLNNTLTLTRTSGALTVDQTTNDPTLNVSGLFSIGASTTFSATNTGALNIKGGLTNSGTFTNNSGTVTMNGTSQQTITGTLTFYDLTVSNSSGSDPQTSPSVIFADGYNYTVSHNFTATTDNVKMRFPQGPTYTFSAANITFNRSSTGYIYMRSNAAGTYWQFNVSGTQSVSYVDVKDSNATGSTINATDGTNVDSTHNLNWDFGGMAISGTANGNNGAAVKVAFNNSVQAQSGTISSGSWIITGLTPASTNDRITVWIDNVADGNESTAVTKYDGTGNITGMVLNTHILTLGSTSESASLVGGDLTYYSNGNDEDIMHTIDPLTNGGSGIRVDGGSSYTDEAITILANTTLTLSQATGEFPYRDTLTTINLNINSTGQLVSSGTPYYNIYGSWINAGTFTRATSVVYFKGTSAGYTITSGGSPFYDIEVNGSGGGWTTSDSLAITDNLTMTLGTLTINNTTTVTGDIFTNDGTINGTGSITVNGGDIYGTNGVVNMSGGTITIPSASGNFGSDSAWTVYNFHLSSTITCADRLTTGYGTGGVTVTNNLATDAVSDPGFTCNCMEGSCYGRRLAAGNKTWTFLGSAPISNSGSITTSGSTFIFTYGGALTVPGGIDYNNLWLQPSATATYTLPGTLGTISGNLLIGDGAHTTTINGTTNNPILSISGNLSCTTGATNTINSGTGNWIVGGDVNLSNCTYTATSGNTLYMSGTSKTFTHNSQALYNFVVSGTIAMSAGNETINNTLTINSGKSLTSTSGILSIGGNFTNNGGTFTHNSGTVALTTSSTATITGSNTFYNFTISGIGAAKTIIFTDLTTTTVSNTLTLNGASGQVVTVQNSTTGSHWNLRHNGTGQTIHYVSAQDSYACGGNYTIKAYDGTNTDATGNSCWEFTSMTISGTSTLSAGTVALAINNSRRTETASIQAGTPNTWSITVGTQASGAYVTAWVDGVADGSESTAITRYDGSGNVTGMDLSTHVVTLGSADNPTLAMRSLPQYDNYFDEDIMSGFNWGAGQTGAGWNPQDYFTDASNSYTDDQLRILSGTTFTLASTWGCTEDCSGLYDKLSRTHDLLNQGTITVSSQNNGPPQIFVDGSWTSSSGTVTPDILQVYFTSASTETIAPGSNSFYDVFFNNASGSWSNTAALNITHNLTSIGGLLWGTQNVTVNGHVQCSGTCGSFAFTAGTFTQSVSAAQNFGTAGLAPDWTFYNLTFSGNTQTVTSQGTGTITVSNTLTIGAGHTLDAGAKTWTLSGSGTPFTLTGSLTASTSTFQYQNTTSATATAATYYNLSLNGGGTPTYTLQNSTYNLGGNLTIAANVTVTPGTSTINMTGTSKTADTNSRTLYNFTTSGTATVSLTSAMVTTNNVTVGSGTTLSGTQNLTVNGGSFTGDGSVNFTGGTVTLPIAGTLGGSSTADWTLNNIALTQTACSSYTTTTAAGSGKMIVGGTITSASCSCGAECTNSHLLNPGAKTWDLTYAGEPLATAILYTTGSTATWQFVGTGNMTVSGQVYYNLVLQPASGTPVYTLVNTTYIPHDLTISSSLSLTEGTSTVAVGGFDLTSTVNAGDQTFYNFQTYASSGTDTVNLTSNMTVSHVLTVGATDNLSIASSKTVTVLNTADASAALTGFGTIDDVSNNGLIIYRDGTAPNTALTVNCNMQFDAVDTNQAFNTDTWGGNVTINNSGTTAGRTVTMGGGTHTFNGNLTVQSTGTGGVTLVGATNNPTVNISGTLSFGAANTKAITSGSGTWTVATDVDFTNGTFTASTNNTLVMNGTNRLFYHNSQTLHNFTVAGTIEMNTGNETISNDLIINNGATLSSTSGILSIGHNFTNSGTFNAMGGTVALTTSAAATITGSNTFNNLSVSAIGAAKTVNFTGNTTTTVSGTFTIAGASGQVVTLQSTDTNSWTINPTTASVDYASVSRSTNVGSIFCATNSTDGGNNINWNFSGGASCGVVISGTVYTNEGSTTYNCSTDNLSVKAVVNGSANNTATCLGSGGTFGMYVSATAGQPIVVYLDGETPKAATITRYNSGTITGLNLYQDRVIVRHEDAGPITDANLGQYDNDNDADIPFTSNANNLVVNAGTKLYVWANKTFTPGGTVTTTTASTAANPDGDIYIASGATMDMGTNALSVGGDFVNAGTFSYSGSQTSTFTATGTGFTITPNGSPFYNLTFNGTGGGWSPSATLTANNDLTVTTGTLSGSQNIAVAGAVAGAGTINLSGGTFTHQPATSVSFGTTSGSADWTFSTLTFSNAVSSTPTTTLASGGTGQIIASALSLTNAGTSLSVDNNTNDRVLDINGAVTIGAGTTLQASNSASFTIGGNWTNSGAFTANGGTVTFDAGTTGRTITDGGSDWGSITFNNGSGGWSFADSTTLTGDMAMTAGTLSGTSDITIGGGDLTGNGTVNLTGGSINMVNAGTFGTTSGSGGWTVNNINLTQSGCAGNTTTSTGGGTGTITVTGTITGSTCSCGVECVNYHRLSAATNGPRTWILSNDTTPLGTNFALVSYETEDSTLQFTGNGAVSIPAGYYHSLDIQGNISAPTYSIGSCILYGNLTIGPSLTANFGTNYVRMRGTTSYIDAYLTSFYDLLFDGTNATTTVQGSPSITVTRVLQVDSGNTMTINSGRTVTFDSPAEIQGSGTINGAGTLRFPHTSGGPGTSLSTLSSLVRYDASGGNVADTTFDARTYGSDVEVYSNTGTARTVTMSAGATQQINGNLKVVTGASQSQGLTLDNSTTSPAVTVTGDLTFTKGGAGTPGITSGGGTWTVSGNINFTNGTYTASTGNTLNMNGSNKSITSAGQTLQNYEVSGGTVSSADAMDVNGTFKVTGGQFTQSATSDMNIAGDFTMENGTTFNKSATSGWIIFDGDMHYNDKHAAKVDIGQVQFGATPFSGTLTSDIAAQKVVVKQNGNSLITDGYDIDAGTGGVEVQAGTPTSSLDASDGTGGTTLITTEDKFEILGTFTPGGSTVTFDGTPVSPATVTLTTSGSPLNNLVVNDPTNANLTVQLQDPLTANGNVTITQGTLDTKSGSNFAITVGGNWSNASTFTANSGTVTFNATTTGHTINPGSSSFYDLTFDGSGGAWSPLTNAVTVTNDLTMKNGTFDTSNGTANVTVNGNVQCNTTCGTIDMTTAGTSTFTQSISADKNFGTNVSGSTNWSFYNLTFNSASGARTVTTNGTGSGQINVTHDLSLTNGGTSLALDNNTNDRILDVGNDVSIATSTTLSSSSSAAFTVAGNWANAGTFTHNNGTVTFDAGSGTKTINPGSSAFYTLTFNNAGGTWQPTINTLTIANNLNVTAGTMDNETNDQVLDVGGDVTIGGSGVLQASSAADFTVAGGWTNAGTFAANSGTVKFDGTSGTKSLNSTGATTASFNNLTLDDGGNAATFQLGSALDVNGNLLITGGTLDTNSGSSYGITIGGNWTNNDTFTANSGPVTADGASQQTFSGTLAGSTGKFYDLTVTNASGSDPVTTPSVIFSGNLETAGTFTANTASTKLRFNAGSTYTLQNISFNGQAQHTRLYLRSSSSGSAWNLNVAGTRNVHNTDVKDSYACGQPPDIDATHISNKDSSGNSCWNFTALTFTLSSNNLNLGTLSTATVTTASHTVQTVTSADNGYVTYVYVDGDLRDSSNTIDAASGTLSAGTEGYGMATSDSGQTVAQDTSCGSAPYNVTALTTSQQSVAGATSGPVNETSTVCYQAAISSGTVAGNYSQVVTFVTVGLF